jgi:hypothetical protein
MPPELVRTGSRSGSVRQVAVAVQQLHRGEEEQPQPDQRGEDTEDEDGGHLLISRPGAVLGRIALPYGVGTGPAMGCRAQANAGAEAGHEQKRDADDDANVKHSDSSISAAGMGASRL